MKLDANPVSPWSLPYVGLPGLALVACALAALTLWTYLGVAGTTPRRLLAVLALRFAALGVAVLALCRPSVVYTQNPDTPSTLLVVVDASKSMTTRDMFDGSARWDYLQRALQESGPALRALREEHNVNVVFVRFAADVGPFDPREPGQADGQRTDFGRMLARLYEEYRGKGPLRGLVVLSDGADNGGTDLRLAAQWRNLPCRVHAVAFGDPHTKEDQKDIKLARLTTEPAEVPVKQKLAVKGIIDAPGFEGARVRVQLFVNNGPEPAATLDTTLPKSAGNPVQLECVAPDKPGQMKVALKVQPLAGEVSVDNNESSTFVRVTKEGISVLLVDRADRFPETQMVARNALRTDRRVRLTTREFRDDKARPGAKDYFRFKEEKYDVILLGDVTAGQMTARDPEALNAIYELVTKQGVGLAVLAGESTFGARSDWKGTPVAGLLPVQLAGGDAGKQVPGKVQVKPLPEGWQHYVMRLADKPEKNDEAWAALRELDGMVRLGPPQANAFILAGARDQPYPVLVGLDDPGAGRRLALAVDTTHRWIRDEAGRDAHRRFWQQLVLWLARQEKPEGNLGLELEQQRLPVGEKLFFRTFLRDGAGDKLKAGRFDVKVTVNGKAKAAPDMAPAEFGERGTFWNTDEPGDYKLEVTGKGEDAAGQPVNAQAELQFHVYADGSETAPQAANHKFLQLLREAGGGQFREARELAPFLQELEKESSPQGGPKTARWPEWRGQRVGGFVVGYFLAFVALLSAEWFLRRRWGLV